MSMKTRKAAVNAKNQSSELGKKASNPRSITYGVRPDVTFVFKDNAELLAEKCKLKQASEVFRKQFSNNFGNNERIMIEDIPYNIFNELVKFIYEKNVEITLLNYRDMLYAATKYFIYSLIEKVIGFVEKYVDVENLVDNFGILDYGIQRINDHFRMICINDPVKIIEKLDASSKSHMDILKVMLESQILNCSEYALYEAVAAMMERSCVDADDVAAEMRKKLGNKLLRLIRFPVMSIKKLILCGKSPSLLTPQEFLDIQLWIQEKIYSDTMQFLSTIPRNNKKILKAGAKKRKIEYLQPYKSPRQDSDDEESVLLSEYNSDASNNDSD